MRMLMSAAFNTRFGVGISRFIQGLVPALARRCTMTVLTPDPELFSGICDTITIPDSVRTNRGRILWSATALHSYCKGEFDVLVCPTPVAPPLSSIPTVVAVHDLTPLILRRAVRGREKLLFWLSLQTVLSASYVIADSDCTRRDLLRLLPGINPSSVRVGWAGPGIGVSVDDSGFASEYKPYVLYVGGLAPHKNVERLIMAFSTLREWANMKLVLVGNTDAHRTESILRTAAANGVSERIRLLAGIPDDELSELYRGCACFVYPSLYEGFGLPVLEALGHNAPSACSSAASIPEVAGPAALYFDPHSVNGIRDSIQMLLRDAALCDSLRFQGQIQARTFSWDRTADIYYRAATDCLEAPGRRELRRLV